MWATSFMGSTLERSTFVHHCRSRVRYDVDLLAVKNLAQLFAVLPRPGGALDGQLGERASSSARRALAHRADHLQAGRAKAQLSRSICHYNA
jgi:hypothetical protein